MGGGAFILVLAVALAESVAPAERKCQLNGLWRNDQDSLMEIAVLRDNGDFQGQYLTRVTLSGGCAQISPLRGAQQQLGEEGWPTFAFTVRWEKFSKIQLVDALVHSMGLRGNAGLEQGSPSSPNIFGATMVGPDLLNTDATTAFVGQCFVDAGGKEMLSTTWLLRENVGSLEEDWKATRVGRNVFTRKRTMKGKILANLSPLCETVSSPAP